MKFTKTIPTVFALLATFALNAQEAIPASGGNAIGSGGSSSYTVGQTVYTTSTGSNGSVAQGVQQAYEISTAFGIEVTEINLEFIAYPNPTNNALTLSIGNYNNDKLTYQLLDLQGKLLASDALTDKITSITLQDFPASTYVLNVLDHQSLIKTFRIVKN